MKKVSNVMALIMMAASFNLNIAQEILENPVKEETTEKFEKKPLSYLQQLKNYAYDTYNQHKNIIDPVIMGLAAVIIGKFAYDKLEESVRESYRIMREERGKKLLQGLELSGLGLPLIFDTKTNNFEPMSREQINQNYGISMSQEMYNLYLESPQIDTSNITEGWKF